MSRPVEFTDKKKQALCDAIKEGMPFSYACDLVGVSRTTAYNHMDKTKDVYDEGFVSQMAVAKAMAVRGLISLVKQEKGAWKLLKNIARDEFTDVSKNIHVGDEEGAPIKMIVEDYRSIVKEGREED
ncbi:MAG: hypothetical protein KDD13_00240 [Mangrovimonas sp.]|nr:hypothetical protein [Mangrovimonas sp.]